MKPISPVDIQRQLSLQQPKLSRLLPLPKLHLLLPVPWAKSLLLPVEAVDLAVEVVAAAEMVVAAEVPIMETIIQIIIPDKTRTLNRTRVKARSLTRRGLKPVQTFQLMPVLATGRKAARRPTVATPSSAAGPTSSSLESEMLASLTK